VNKSIQTYPPLYILRHGQTEWNLECRRQGSLNSPLTDLGRAQATDQREILKTVFAKHPKAQVVRSPQGRARDTAEIALAERDVIVCFDPRVAEVTSGVWTGMKHDVIAAEWPDFFNSEITIFEASLNAVGGEGYDGLKTRCHSFLESITEPSVVISHGITSMVIRGLACGLEYDAIKMLPYTQWCVFALIGGNEQIMTR
jgi:broad specificity phosphatase PhoE